MKITIELIRIKSC